jgi:hypothetical protein
MLSIADIGIELSIKKNELADKLDKLITLGGEDEIK